VVNSAIAIFNRQRPNFARQEKSQTWLILQLRFSTREIPNVVNSAIAIFNKQRPNFARLLRKLAEIWPMAITRRKRQLAAKAANYVSMCNEFLMRVTARLREHQLAFGVALHEVDQRRPFLVANWPNQHTHRARSHWKIRNSAGKQPRSRGTVCIDKRSVSLQRCNAMPLAATSNLGPQAKHLVPCSR
jgi:hypothetical protein